MVAWLMDATLREGSHGKAGLPELFALLWSRHGEGGLGDADIRRAFQELSGQDPKAFWAAYISGRAELDPAPLRQAYGLAMESRAPWEGLSSEEQEDPAAVRRARAWTGLVLNAQGPTVQNVLPGSPAARAGLSFGMEILAVDGWRTTTSAEVQRGLAEPGPGGSTLVLAADHGRILEARVPVIENPERSHRLATVPQATAGQRAAFHAAYGQAFPSASRRSGQRR
jgi:predicted metalloprotease with PDZ domain